jgi:hypothetical protein
LSISQQQNPGSAWRAGLARVAVPALVALTLAASAAAATAASASWSPEKLLTGSILGASNVRSAVNGQGRAVLVWDQLMGVDAAHPQGIHQVFAAVRASRSAGWSKARALSAPGNANNAGAVVAGDGTTVTVFWNEEGVPKSGRSTTLGRSWAKSAIPGGAGFTLITGTNPVVGPDVGIDGKGRITVILAKPNGTTPASESLEAMTRGAGGAWHSPVAITGPSGAQLFGSTRLKVLADGRAFLNYGFTTAYRTAADHWQPARTVSLAGFGTVYSASADMDQGGKAYFAFRSRYLGARLAISANGQAWTPPASIADFDTLGANLWIVAANAGHALIYGNDMNTGNVDAAATGDGAASFKPLADFGLGDSPQAVGSANGLFALGWSSAGANADSYAVAAGSFLGAKPTVQTTLSGGFAAGALAIAAKPVAGKAEAVAGLVHDDVANPGTVVVGGISGLLGR